MRANTLCSLCNYKYLKTGRLRIGSVGCKLMFWGLHQPLIFRDEEKTMHTEVQLLAGLFCTHHTWCWQLSNTRTSWVILFQTDRSVLLNWYLIIFLATKPCLTEGCCEIARYTKELAWNNQFYMNSPLHPTKSPPDRRAVWVHARNRGIEAVLWS